ncbi:site-specific tyrosine recombinase XerC [Xenorhabdus sp. Vera]|uniref:site-specific tyrosine recombinase XerC n=1 Tax=Xenorhabdus koppenhoeferi TaxID=351659 RepID=UPI0019A09594|nr:site-specific tyrosine recombinase XerC [Xenorhabdus sp. Vera]MBD2812484.1 site-specific tyrosine recombinase XerC [Xenorhabdus sp. Vera]
MANRKPRKGSFLSVDEVYRKPVGPAHDPKSLYALLLRFVAWRRERNWSDTTLKVQTHHTYHFILWATERGLYYAADITRPILERYQRHLYQYRKKNGEPLSTRTQRTQLEPLKVWFKWLTRQNLILANPAADLELPRLEKHLPRYILTIEETEQILAQPDLETLQGVRDRALMELLWSTGMRRGEVTRLDVYSVDGVRKTVTVRQGKGNRDRVLPIGERALGWLLYYQNEIRPQLLVNPDVKALFVAMDGQDGLQANGISNMVTAYIKAVGIEKKGACHLFRHAMATQMLENGADLRWIQVMLGHASVESTQIYTQVSIRALQAVHASTHPAERQTDETPDNDETDLLADLYAEDNAGTDTPPDSPAPTENPGSR